MTPMRVRTAFLIKLFLLTDKNNSVNARSFIVTSCICRRYCLWGGWGRGNNSGSVAGGLLDRHQFVFWREGPRSTAVGFFWRVYSDVCSKNCRRFSWNWPPGGITSHDCRYRNSSKLHLAFALPFPSVFANERQIWWLFVSSIYYIITTNLWLCIKLGHGQGDGDIDTRVWGPGTWGRKTRVLGTSSGGRGDMWDGDAVREIQGHGGRKDINDYCKSRRWMLLDSIMQNHIFLTLCVANYISFA